MSRRRSDLLRFQHQTPGDPGAEPTWRWCVTFRRRADGKRLGKAYVYARTAEAAKRRVPVAETEGYKLEARRVPWGSQ